MERNLFTQNVCSDIMKAVVKYGKDIVSYIGFYTLNLVHLDRGGELWSRLYFM